MTIHCKLFIAVVIVILCGCAAHKIKVSEVAAASREFKADLDMYPHVFGDHCIRRGLEGHADAIYCESCAYCPLGEPECGTPNGDYFKWCPVK